MTRGAVDRWLRPPDSEHYRICPDGALELLELKLGTLKLRKVKWRPKK